MAWDGVRNRKKDKQLAKQAAAAVARQVGEEIRRSLFGFGSNGNGNIASGKGLGDTRPRGPQWHCSLCMGLPNDLKRSCCRG